MRVFIAIELPHHIHEQLAKLQARLCRMAPFVRWTRPEQIHLTLKFLGEVADSRIPEVCSSIMESAALLHPIPMDIRGAGCFPPSGPTRIVWAGIVGPPTELSACHAACEHALAKLGYPPEDRDFHPHLTIGRSREPRGSREIRSMLDAAGVFSCEPFTATNLTVFQSVLGRAGPTYTVLTRAGLKSR